MAKIRMHRSRAVWNDTEDPVAIKKINCKIRGSFGEGCLDSREREAIHRAKEYISETVWSRGWRKVRSLSKELKRENKSIERNGKGIEELLVAGKCL